MILAKVRATAKEGKRGELQQTLQAACRETRGFPGHERFLRPSDARSVLFVAKWTDPNPWDRPRKRVEGTALAELMELLRTVTPLCDRAEIELQTGHEIHRTGTSATASQGALQGLRASAGTPDAQDRFELQKNGPVEAAVRRVESFIREHLDEPLVVSDLAAVAGVSVRTIFRKFRRDGRRSPMKALAAARLQQVRRRLLEGEPDDTVTRAATDSGFTHLSRFSGLYKKTYGEPPSETLRRAQRCRRDDRFRGPAVGRAGRLPFSTRAHSSLGPDEAR